MKHIKVLFVCHGNICRSAMAKYILKDKIKEQNLDIFVDSAATSSEEIGNSIYPPVFKLLNDKNIDASNHVARKIRKEDYDDFDYLIGMDNENLYSLKNFFNNDPKHKIYKLLEFCDSNDEVEDPWYTRNFEQAYNDINKGIEGFLEKYE